MEFKHTENTIGVAAFLELPEIDEIKQDMLDRFESQYGIHSHFTLAMTAFPQENIEKCADELARLVGQTNSLEISLSDIYYEEEKRFLAVHIKKTQELYNLHLEILEIINRHRNGCIRTKEYDKLLNQEELGEDRMELLRKYGYYRLEKLFKPHITIGNFENTENQEIISKYIDQVERKLEGLINSRFEIARLRISLIKDTEDQTDHKLIFSMDIDLEKAN